MARHQLVQFTTSVKPLHVGCEGCPTLVVSRITRGEVRRLENTQISSKNGDTIVLSTEDASVFIYNQKYMTVSLMK